MALTKTDIERIVLRAERTTRREMDRHERRQAAAVEDPDRNRQMMLKKRMKWRSKFNVLGLLFIGCFMSLFALFTASGLESGQETVSSGWCAPAPRPDSDNMPADFTG